MDRYSAHHQPHYLPLPKQSLSILISLLLWFSPSLYAIDYGNDPELDISGVILDRTITKRGHLFCQQFSNIWNPPQLIQGYNLTIKEQPSARWGNIIKIETQRLTVYQTVIRPGNNQIDALTKQAAAEIARKLFGIAISEKSTDSDLSTSGF